MIAGLIVGAVFGMAVTAVAMSYERPTPQEDRDALARSLGSETWK